MTSKEFSGIVDATDFNELGVISLSEVIKRHDFILVMGGPLTGKTKTMRKVLSLVENPVLHWERDRLMDMLFYNYPDDYRMMTTISHCEQQLLSHAFALNHPKIVCTGRFRLPHHRLEISKFLPKEASKGLIVFDGSKSCVTKRATEINNQLMPEELQEIDMIDKIKFPTFGEGWHEIVYVNTFGNSHSIF